jgi:H+/gluconate symporter-like permease
LFTSGSGSAEQYADALNRALLDPKLFSPGAFSSVQIDEKLRSSLLSDQLRTKPVDMRRMNRQLLEATFPQWVGKHDWNTTKRKISDGLSGLGNASFALSIAALIAIGTLAWAKNRSLTALAGDVEESLMSGGLIILITAAGGAFGAMLQRANISGAIQSFIDLQGGGGMMVMVIGFGIAALLKVAQGSSTVAMIIGSSMVAAMVNVETLPYHTAYLVTAIGGGSLVGSWMNDSGFWVYAKMGGLTEAESLKTWTPMLVFLGVTALGFSLLFGMVMPLKG